MIASPPVPDERVCAALFFQGVLRAFEDFVKFDPFAAEIASRMKGVVLFEDRSGNTAALSFSGSGVSWTELAEKKERVRIQLGRQRNVVAFVRGGTAFPLLARGWSSPIFLFRLGCLFLRFQRLLRPRDGDLKGEDFRLLHVRLALAVALFSLAVVGREDGRAREIVGDCPDGAIRFSVKGSDLEAVVVKDDKGLRPRRGGNFDGDSFCASVSFGSSKVAMEILTRKMDAHGAVALGQIEVEGLVPLADAVNHVLDRVALYLPT